MTIQVSLIFFLSFSLLFVQRKIDRGMRTLGFYNTREYVYKNEVFMSLPNSMNEKDRDTFYSDFKRVSRIYANQLFNYLIELISARYGKCFNTLCSWNSQVHFES